MFINEQLQTKVYKEYDVAVCGGGFAGISAALASARQGKKTVLFEKMYMLGGLGTAGLIAIYLPICDGHGHQVSFAIAEELFHLSIKHGHEGKYPENWLTEGGSRTENDPRFQVQYNPQMFAILAEKLLTEAGVDILYGTYAVGVDMKDDKIDHIIVENKSGRLAYKVRSVVDATGDADIALLANAPTDTFKQGNILAAWYYSSGENGYKMHILGAADVRDGNKEESAKRMLVNRRFTGIDGDDVSDFMRLSHENTYNDYLKKKADEPDLALATLATMPQYRMTRKIVGEYELSNAEMHTYFDDSIGMISDWRKRGPIYEVPFRTLYSAKVKNLICAGRCTSVTQDMWDIMRVIPCCAVTGQAAGTAAAMTDDFSSLDVKALQKQLEADGVILHEKEILG